MHPEETPKVYQLPFRPHSLAYKLRRLFDAGVITPETLAKSLGQPIYRVDRWLRGGQPDPVTRLQLDKVLSYYKRQEFGYLKLEEETATEPLPDRKMGVREDLDALAGTNAFNVYGASGKRLGRWEAQAGVTDPQLLEAFDGLIQRKDGPHIEAMPASGEQVS